MKRSRRRGDTNNEVQIISFDHQNKYKSDDVPYGRPLPAHEYQEERRRLILCCLCVSFAVVYVTSTVYTFLLGGLTTTNLQLPPPKTQDRPNVVERRDKQERIQRQETPAAVVVEGYEHWKKIAVDLAALPADEALKELEKDPFGVRHFEEQLVAAESKHGRLLERHELLGLFSCPSSSSLLISLPDQRNHTQGMLFRNATKGTFLFFQHLRKAGGTHFCSLARANLPSHTIARYYCMPDMAWSGNKNAGYLHHWSNAEIQKRMLESGHRIAGNEWDWFDPQHHFELPAVFATSFRKPLDRALSQFRFECLEHRGCTQTNVTIWWQHRVDLYNVYTQTFADPQPHGRFGKWKQIYQDTSDQQERRAQLLADALDTVAKFHLVLVMEWLAYAGPLVTKVLGFDDTSVLTQRVRPHISQAQRADGQDENKLGAAGITKASWDAHEYLTPAQYQIMSRDLALDSILTDAARRLFLERLVCEKQ